MPTCRECQFYKPIDENRGDCFGHTVDGDSDSEECPTQSFQPAPKGKA